jgi:hypothetical protein
LILLVLEAGSYGWKGPQAMPEFDSATGMLTLPWWIAAAVAACALLLGVVALLRGGLGRAIAGIAGFVVIAAVLAGAWNLHERSMARERADERRILDARVTDLNLRALAPGSALACLGTSAGEIVEAACERALFATPENVAAAVAYADARMALLNDAAEFAARGNDYDQAVSALRRSVEADRFGLYAHVLAQREGCNADSCDAATMLLMDPARVLANLKDGTFQAYVARHAANWGQPSAGPALASAPPAASPSGPTVTTSASFPTAASIPPISIMNNEPGMPGQNGMEDSRAEAKPEPKPEAKPAARRAATKRAPDPGPPVPIAPPRPAAANTAGSAPAAQ